MSQYRMFAEPETGRAMRVARVTVDLAGYQPVKFWCLVPVGRFGGHKTDAQDLRMVVATAGDCRTREEVERKIAQEGIFAVTEVREL